MLLVPAGEVASRRGEADFGELSDLTRCEGDSDCVESCDVLSTPGLESTVFDWEAGAGGGAPVERGTVRATTFSSWFPAEGVGTETGVPPVMKIKRNQTNQSIKRHGKFGKGKGKFGIRPRM